MNYTPYTDLGKKEAKNAKIKAVLLALFLTFTGFGIFYAVYLAVKEVQHRWYYLIGIVLFWVICFLCYFVKILVT